MAYAAARCSTHSRGTVYSRKEFSRYALRSRATRFDLSLRARHTLALRARHSSSSVRTYYRRLHQNRISTGHSRASRCKVFSRYALRYIPYFHPSHAHAVNTSLRAVRYSRVMFYLFTPRCQHNVLSFFSPHSSVFAAYSTHFMCFYRHIHLYLENYWTDFDAVFGNMFGRTRRVY